MILVCRNSQEVTIKNKAYLSEFDYYNVAHYEKNWKNRKVFDVNNKSAKLITCRMFEGQYVNMVELFTSANNPQVTRGDLHRVAPFAVRGQVEGSKSANLDKVLGTPTGCEKREGTAIVTSGNFKAINSWHQMVSFAAHYDAMKTVLGENNKADYLVLTSLGRHGDFVSPFSTAFGVFYKKRIVSELDTRSHCYKRVIFTDVPEDYVTSWVGAMWQLAGWKSNYKEVVKRHPEMQRVYQRMQAEVLQEVEPREKRKERNMCYIKRKTGGPRGFASQKDENEFLRLVNPNVTLDFHPNDPAPIIQVRSINQCSSIIGIHGAGLGYMFWADKGLRVIELVDDNNCRGYYANMAHILGHNYECIGVRDYIMSL